MKYTKQNNIHIIEISPTDFKIIMNDSKKKSAAPKNYCNAGFFANYDENNQYFTLPVAHLVCDYDATSKYTKKYCTERGKFNGNKFTFDSSTWSYCNAHYKKPISTLLIKNNKAEIKEIVSIPTGYNYAISGIPIMKNGLSVSFEKDVVSQGWDSSPLYGTWHVFIGLKKNTDTIYIIGMETTTWNMVKTNEAYKKLKSLDMYNVIKLDGGGSFHINVDGQTVASTHEDRRINTIICFNSNNGDNNGDDGIKKESIANTKTQTSTIIANKDVSNTKTDTKKNTDKLKHIYTLKSFLKKVCK